MRRARHGAREPVWIAAREQTKGRGRQGRPWLSPQGNLAASLLLINPAPMALAPQLGFVTGVALAEAVRELVPNGVAPRLKWPNDLVVEGAKLSGLLLEAAQLADGPFACVIGIGLNVLAHPENLPYPATSLRELGSQAGAELALERIAAHMSVWLTRWNRGDDFAAIRSAWMDHAAALDERVAVQTGSGQIEGIFRGLDAMGQMILDTDASRLSIAAGDVFLPRTQAPTGKELR